MEAVTGNLFMDQTGHFPIPFSQEHKNVIMFCPYQKLLTRRIIACVQD